MRTWWLFLGMGVFYLGYNVGVQLLLAQRGF